MNEEIFIPKIGKIYEFRFAEINMLLLCLEDVSTVSHTTGKKFLTWKWLCLYGSKFDIDTGVIFPMYFHNSELIKIYE